MLAGMPVYPRSVIREALPADYPAAFRVMSAAYPAFVQTEAGFVHRQVAVPPESRSKGWVAEEDGSIVGWARAQIRYEEPGGAANIGVSVVPPWRGRGIGSALYERAFEHVADAPRAHALCSESGRAFVEARGYDLRRTSHASSLDPRSVDTSDLDASSVQLQPLSEAGPEATYAVDSVASLDVPADEPYRIDYALWKRRYWESPDLDFTSSFGARVDGRLVAVAYVGVDLAGDRALSAFTGTLPEYRGRGLARLVKLAVVRRLDELGVSRLYAYNHDENAAILAVNERLGFRPVATQYFYVRERGET
jgi:RimJ/RimL family protein N-acetyltransferase